ncbi:hypothetical protein D0Y65_017383 [Glycine soja]|uniref:Uncharacterized protein n=1 Tax=Glycine soja TaxID=3848 RepID=A0A445JUQ4_GLYSO|nr:hypothetical protein D0Y65_017383 [Glycine soja]
MGPTYTDMGCKLALEDKERVTFRRRQRNEHVDATRHAKTCNFSSLASQQQGHITKEKLIEFLCSSCLLCVCCPLACACCFIKLPCRICHQALRCAWKWACYGSKNNRVRADYSSFSDIDSNATSGKVKKPSRVFLKTEEDTDFINCYLVRPAMADHGTRKTTTDRLEEALSCLTLHHESLAAQHSDLASKVAEIFLDKFNQSPPTPTTPAPTSWFRQ